ncbi:MAG: homoserine dehydrogenase, partial [Ferruginibacter sp.]
DVYNGLVTESSFADKHFFKGKGAGAFPTAAAVLSDISALQYNYRYEYKKLGLSNTAPSSPDYFLKVYVSADDIANIDLEKFEWIDEWHNEHNNAWVSGGISAGSLQENRWWQVEGVSLILNESPVMEDISYKAVQKESLRLAGVLEHY